MLRALAKNWMPLLLNAFLATPPVQRTQLEEAISAYACCCEPATLAQFFRAVVTKLIKVRGGWAVRHWLVGLAGRRASRGGTIEWYGRPLSDAKWCCCAIMLPCR